MLWKSLEQMRTGLRSPALPSFDCRWVCAWNSARLESLLAERATVHPLYQDDIEAYPWIGRHTFSDKHGCWSEIQFQPWNHSLFFLSRIPECEIRQEIYPCCNRKTKPPVRQKILIVCKPWSQFHSHKVTLFSLRRGTLLNHVKEITFKIDSLPEAFLRPKPTNSIHDFDCPEQPNLIFFLFFEPLTWIFPYLCSWFPIGVP